MTKTQLKKICDNNTDISDVLYILSNQYELNFNDINDYENLKEFAKHNIDNDNLFLAKHIIEGLENGYDFYCYDLSMGTCEDLEEIKNVDELYDILCFKLGF